MAIPKAIKTNFNTLEKAFENGDIALLECRYRNNGEPAYAICAINLVRQADRDPEIEIVPLSLMFNIYTKRILHSYPPSWEVWVERNFRRTEGRNIC